MTTIPEMIARYFRGMPLRSVAPRLYSSDMPPEQIVGKLGSFVDSPQRDLLSLDGYAGQSPLIGTITRHEFEVLPRRVLFFNTLLAPSIVGFIEPSNGGTHVTARVNFRNGALPAFVRIWLRIAASVFMVMAFPQLWTNRQNEAAMAAALGMFCLGLLIALWQKCVNQRTCEAVHRILSEITGERPC